MFAGGRRLRMGGVKDAPVEGVASWEGEVHGVVSIAGRGTRAADADTLDDACQQRMHAGRALVTTATVFEGMASTKLVTNVERLWPNPLSFHVGGARGDGDSGTGGFLRVQLSHASAEGRDSMGPCDKSKINAFAGGQDSKLVDGGLGAWGGRGQDADDDGREHDCNDAAGQDLAEARISLAEIQHLLLLSRPAETSQWAHRVAISAMVALRNPESCRVHRDHTGRAVELSLILAPFVDTCPAAAKGVSTMPARPPPQPQASEKKRVAWRVVTPSAKVQEDICEYACAYARAHVCVRMYACVYAFIFRQICACRCVMICTHTHTHTHTHRCRRSSVSFCARSKACGVRVQVKSAPRTTRSSPRTCS